MAKDNTGVKEEATKVVSSETQLVNEVNTALQTAAATAALKASIEANAEMAERQAEKEYINKKQKFMLTKCKNDKKVTFVGDEIYAQYFGKVYTYSLNTIPVTVYFDGSEQELPKFIYEDVMRRIHEVSKKSKPIVDIDKRYE